MKEFTRETICAWHCFKGKVFKTFSVSCMFAHAEISVSQVHFSNLYFPRNLPISSSYSNLFEKSSVKDYFTKFLVFYLHSKFSIVILCIYTSFFIHSHFFTHLIRQLRVTYSVSPTFLNKLLGLLPNSTVFLFSRKPISVLI